MTQTTRRGVIHGSAVALVGSLAGCLGGPDDGEPRGGGGTPTGADTAGTGPGTLSGTPTDTPTPTAVPPSALDSGVVVRFDESPNLPGNGVEIRDRDVGTPAAVKAYVSDGEGDTRWARFTQDRTGYSIYRNEDGVMVGARTADAGIETGGDPVTGDGVGWEAGTSPERTVEVYGVVDGEEGLLELARGTV